MKKSMFNILFDYKGEIDNREYLYGVIAILFSIFVTLHHHILSVSQVFVIQKLGVESMAKWSLNSQIFNHFFPNFIPFGFIVFYCTFVLSIKRFRSFGLNSFWGIISGLLTFIAFKCLLTIPTLVMLIQGQFSSYGSMQTIKPEYFLIVFSLFFLLGLLIIILLSCIKPTKQKTSSYNKSPFFSISGKLKDYEYVAFMGRLYAAGFLAGIGVFLLTLLAVYLDFPERKLIWPTSILTGFLIIFAGAVYISLCIRRSRDFGLKGRWVLLIFFLYMILLTGAGVGQQFSMNENLVFLLSNLIIFSAVSLWSLQFLLFVIPGKQREVPEKETIEAPIQEGVQH